MLKTKFQHVLKFVIFQHALKFLTWFSACLQIFNIVFNTMVHNIGEFQNSTFDIFIPLMQIVV